MPSRYIRQPFFPMLISITNLTEKKKALTENKKVQRLEAQEENNELSYISEYLNKKLLKGQEVKQFLNAVFAR